MPVLQEKPIKERSMNNFLFFREVIFRWIIVRHEEHRHSTRRRAGNDPAEKGKWKPGSYW